MQRIGQYLLNFIHLLDQIFNTLIGGDPRMTLSARMGRDISQGKCKFCGYICKLLNVFQSDHCARSWNAELNPPDPSHQVVDE